TSAGMEARRGMVAAEDAEAVARLRAAGAIILGTTNLPELSARGFTDNKLAGIARNPWDTSRTPGGSTGGGAAAVAAGLGPLTLGTDAGGSIRRPACHVGVVGFKPTHGRVPLGPGFAPTSPGYTVNGPLGRTVADAATMFSVMAGPDLVDRTSFLPPLDASPADLATPLDLAGKRVAWSPDLGDRPVDPRVRSLCEAAVRAFENLGARVEVAHPSVPHDFEDVVVRALGGPATVAFLAPYLPAHADDFDAGVHATLAAGARVTGREVYEARQRQAALYADMVRFFERYDLLLTPTAAALPWTVEAEYPNEIDGKPVGPRGHSAFTPFANHAGLPAISVPAGWTDDNLPVGLQIVGPFLADAPVLRAAAAFEQARPWADRWPHDPTM
ncbi:MAG: amidase, partial [Chloroflexota bacterium]|nr:amidase [Chloroflexota bacterium]